MIKICKTALFKCLLLFDQRELNDSTDLLPKMMPDIYCTFM